MKVFYSILLFASILAVSCSNKEFKEVDPSSFNEQIADRTDIEKPKDLIALYYGIDSAAKNRNISIAVKKVKKDVFKIRLIHDKLEDDSVRGMQIVLQARKSGNKWVVESILENWKCWEGRGHTEWGIEMCQ
ncbi:MAG: hypothetical protein JXR19_06725 [Bacteroidia bacterium]